CMCGKDSGYRVVLCCDTGRRDAPCCRSGRGSWPCRTRSSDDEAGQGASWHSCLSTALRFWRNCWVWSVRSCREMLASYPISPANSGLGTVPMKQRPLSSSLLSSYIL
uniref:Uncharacterized protein n=1 Tax=Aegilops tauschii subsp. strangulata TaxID=200361 RepID=A0A453KSP4_AEGTS